ncbi:MAG TPA: hypothetical protein DEG43_02035 [Acidimicrobiaceae bacterium]|jgi:heme/copper-type cytochrome/quinol oxidase subunit 3|nr:hypothetical protein [Acidimicrobiaceae bacterium]
MTLIPATVPLPALPRRRQLLLGTALAAGASAMFQLALVGMYLNERAAHKNVWLTENTIPLTQPNMMLGTLVLACVFVQWAVWAIARNERGQSFLALGVTLLLGFGFLNQATFLWTEVKMPLTSVEGPLFYATTGANFFAIAASLVYLALMSIRAIGGQFSSRRPDGISAPALFFYVNVAVYAVIWLAVHIMK